MKKSLIIGVCIASLLTGGATTTLAQDVKGGVLNLAMIGEPPTLDIMLTPTDIVGTITQHIFETLYAYDAAWKPAPLLAAEMPTVSEDGLTYTIPLREGITFHDGSALTSSDVIASLNRWLRINSKGKQVAAVVSGIEASGDFSVVIKLKSRYAPLISTISASAAIMPEEKLADTLSEFIGTGPYKLKERKPDQYIQLVRFDEYKSPEGEPSNFAGKRVALADEIVFNPVPDANTRVEGLISGQYDYADSLPFSAYDRIESSEKSEPVVLEASGWTSFNMNMKEGVLVNKQLRQAVQAALNASDMMAAAFDSPKFYSVDAPYYPDGYFWHSEAGVVRYGEGDPEAAATLLKEAGYDDKPLRILTSRQYEFHYKMAQVAEVYLEAAGFKVELLVSDWATLTTRRADPTAWEIFITHSPFAAEPSMLNTISDAYPGWYTSEAKTAALNEYLAATSDEAAFAGWEKMQTAIFDDASLFKVGNFNGLSGISKDIKNYKPVYWPVFWNVEARH